VPKRLITDPIELIVSIGLDRAHIEYVHESEGDPRNRDLDFYLPSLDLHLEVKQYHSDWIAKQMARVNNIIAIQGRAAAHAFVDMITPKSAG
jgi:hypothetical protein